MPSSYEYYVHYEEFDRRMDEWVNYARIKSSNEKINDKKPKAGPKNRAANDETKKLHGHGGEQEHKYDPMDDRALQIHNEITKFKTIDMIEIGKWRCETWYQKKKKKKSNKIFNYFSYL